PPVHRLTHSILLVNRFAGLVRLLVAWVLRPLALWIVVVWIVRHHTAPDRRLKHKVARAAICSNRKHRCGEHAPVARWNTGTSQNTLEQPTQHGRSVPRMVPGAARGETCLSTYAGRVI